MHRGTYGIAVFCEALLYDYNANYPNSGKTSILNSPPSPCDFQFRNQQQSRTAACNLLLKNVDPELLNLAISQVATCPKGLPIPTCVVLRHPCGFAHPSPEETLCKHWRKLAYDDMWRNVEPSRWRHQRGPVTMDEATTIHAKLPCVDESGLEPRTGV